MWNHEYVGKNYNAVNGFVARKGIYRLEPMAGYTFFPKVDALQSINTELYMDFYTDLEFKRLDDLRRASTTFRFLNTSELYFEGVSNYTRLRGDFDPTFNDNSNVTYFEGQDFQTYNFGIGFWSSIINKFRYKLNLDYGQYYDGTKTGTRVELIYRIQPYANFTLLVNNNFVSLPGFEDVNLTRIGPKVEFTITNKLFLNYYLQFNSINDNLANNFRIQWRFKPLSDIYLVYSDNYGASSDFEGGNYNIDINQTKNRAIVFKMVYWLNL